MRKVLSIQSHVVSGYVGNKAAVFPLQLLGFDVDFVNSVQFSNHTGYPSLAGRDQVLNSDNLRSIMDGLDRNHLNKYSHVLTGYVGSVSFLTQIVTEVAELKKLNPSLRYHCDPVLGDNEEFYVPEDLVQIYRDQVLPIADVITPNDFEVWKLTGERCESLDQTLKAIEKLHSLGPKIVVLSSVKLDPNQDQLTMICSQNQDDNSAHQKLRIDFPRLPGAFTGTGDLFSALFLAWLSKCGDNNIVEACERTVSTVFEVLKRTCERDVTGGDTLQNGCSVPPELKLIQSKSSIEAANILFPSEAI